MCIARGTVALAAAVALTSTLWPSPGSTQGMYAYPTKGQGREQQERDHFECYTWARQQTGYDPANPPRVVVQKGYQAPPLSSSGGGLFAYGSGEVGQGGVVGDGARGAATGALIGAIAGDAGKGAAIGAAGGAMFGGIRRSQRQYEQQQWDQYQAQQRAQAQQQAQAQVGQMRANYDRAYAACMAARDYKVQ